MQYHLGDHLGSSNLVVDEDGSFINREEYTPYGETSFGSFARKRYRFTGKERDEESGLYYHGARYYAPWLARWTACGPLVVLSALPREGGMANRYAYCRNRPLTNTDRTGAQDEGAEPSSNVFRTWPTPFRRVNGPTLPPLSTDN